MKEFYVRGLACLMLFYSTIALPSFADAWEGMQDIYRKLLEIEAQSPYQERTQVLYHHYWQGVRQSMQKFLLGVPQQHFLSNKDVAGTMVRRNEQNAGAQFEIDYLTYCLDNAMREKVVAFKDVDFGYNFVRVCKEFNCHATTLGHLYYATKTLQHADKQVVMVVEFGAGFGCLARVFKNLEKEATVVCIDMPEFLALQYFYLKETCPDVSVMVHTSVPTVLEKKAIHLIPVFFVQDIDIKSDVFISTFALSESPEYTQRLLFNKKLFGARCTYMSGQIHTKQHGLFVNHSVIHEGMRALYSDISLIPFHWNFDTYTRTYMPSYEIIGRTQR